jgi:hypothetical protein
MPAEHHDRVIVFGVPPRAWDPLRVRTVPDPEDLDTIRRIVGEAIEAASGRAPA